MQSGSRFWRFSQSLTFNIVMIVVSLAVLAEIVVSIQTSQAPLRYCCVTNRVGHHLWPAQPFWICQQLCCDRRISNLTRQLRDSPISPIGDGHRQSRDKLPPAKSGQVQLGGWSVKLDHVSVRISHEKEVSSPEFDLLSDLDTRGVELVFD